MNLPGELILVLDAGTTSTRAMIFDRSGAVRAVAQHAVTQQYPQPGWVEHDADQIWQLTLAAARQVVTVAGGADRIAAIGVTNQRETVVAWDRQTGEPLHRALVWQDRRTADACAALRAAGHEPAVQEATGLLLDPYFSASKMRWLLDQEPAVREASAAGRLALGTIETWLIFKLTGGVQITDATNASRTSLLPLTGPSWDMGLCDLFGVPRSALGEVTDNAGALGMSLAEHFGAQIAITGMAGDQQAATIGQGCLSLGETKATYGTGAFVLTNMGSTAPKSRHRLLATVLCQIGGTRSYALEGSVFVAGSLIQWLRDTMGLIASADEAEQLARSVPDAGGVVLVPALSGLGAPHWRPEARASITGMSFATTRAHVVRAALEAMAAQTCDLAAAFAGDGATWNSLRIDGGMSANDWIVQDLANMLDLPVERPEFVETTALGAAMLAGYGAGMFETVAEAVKSMRGKVGAFAPAFSGDERQARLEAWHAALAKV
jgi:glycerol kinase